LLSAARKQTSWSTARSMHAIHQPPMPPSPRAVPVSPNLLHLRRTNLDDPPTTTCRHREGLSRAYSALRLRSDPLTVDSTTPSISTSLHTIDTTIWTLLGLARSDNFLVVSVISLKSRPTQGHETSKTATCPPPGILRVFSNVERQPEECDRCSTRCKEEDGQQAAAFGIRSQGGSQSA
jgi:hypothetical protein